MGLHISLPRPSTRAGAQAPACWCCHVERSKPLAARPSTHSQQQAARTCLMRHKTLRNSALLDSPAAQNAVLRTDERFAPLLQTPSANGARLHAFAMQARRRAVAAFAQCLSSVEML